ncbi:MAG: type II secretion system GspH family protein [Gammaproteobacteria bacterium]|nr:type II secretion system GspH family protein [Gammaproteobacteria bacterium]MDH3449068.1 type II secretion system GspH family protein [Gammaproteobacteria bacterium]
MIVVKNYHNSGFSLIELLAVVILLGILGVVALGRFGNTDIFAARGFFDDTVSAVRFAQKLAISSGCDVRVITTAAGYELRQSSGCTVDDFANPVANPARRTSPYQNAEPPPGGYILSSGNITFNARGEREEATSDFTFSDGATTFTFRVHAGTGLVEKI